MTGKFPPKDLTEEISPEMMFSWVIIFNSNLVAATAEKMIEILRYFVADLRGSFGFNFGVC